MKITLIYNKSGMHIKTIHDHVMSFKKYSIHKIKLVDYNDFHSIYKINTDNIILHYSVMHIIACNLINFIDIIKLKDGISNLIISKQLINKKIKLNIFYHLTNFLVSYRGNKFAFIQDEYYDTNLMKIFLEIININTVFTCIPKEHISKIYNNLNNTGFVFNLTGYIPDYNFDIIPIKDRTCDVFYRGRELHYWYGDLGQDKMNIGKYMKKYCDKYDLVSNIDWHGNNCIYGDKWFKVLGNSKVTLATESGTTIFDIDNTLVTDINIALEEEPNRGHQNGYSKVPKYSYEEISKLVNLKRNEVPNMGQVSPKMFEAIMLGTVLVMYEGYYYPGFFIPDVHYIVLKKDYSNINDVINKIKDDNFLQKMSDRAYNDIIRSGKYSYKNFIEMFDKEVENKCIYKPNYIGNKNLEWFPLTEYMNKSIIKKKINEINNLSNKYDAVLMLTWSNWLTEPRSNRYHYAKRFSNELPVYFVQPYEYDEHHYIEKLNIYPNINLIKYSYHDTHEKKNNIKFFNTLMKKNNIKNPLLWIYSPFYQDIIDLYPNSIKIYHATEHYFNESNLLFNTKEYQVIKNKLINTIKQCNLIVSVSEQVNNDYIKKINLNKEKTIVIENGCDAEFYIDFKNKINLNETKEKIVIYQGGINKRVDFILLKNIINKLPDWEFWFCGLEDTTIDIWNEIKKLPHVKYYGGLKCFQRLGELMCKATVGIIPYIQDEIINGSFPLKAFEYISCGLPVVTVPIKSLKNKNKVYKGYKIFQFATSAEDFVKKIKKGYKYRYNKTFLTLREKVSVENSYNMRFKKLKNKILWDI